MLGVLRAFEYSEFLNLPHRVFLQFSCMNFGVYLQRETVK